MIPNSSGRAGLLHNLALLMGLGLAAPAFGAVFIVDQPWVAPVHAGGATEAYMNLTHSDGAVLVAARSDMASDVSLRARAGNGRKLGELPLPAHVTVRLAPRGNRLVLSGVARRLELGKRMSLTLTLRLADGSHQDIPVNAEVRLRSPVDDELRAHRHTH